MGNVQALVTHKRVNSPQRAKPFRILILALLFALNSKKRMAHDRTNRFNKHLIRSIKITYRKYYSEFQLSKKLGNPDFSILARAEASISKQYLRILFIRLKMDGYNITKRIHNDSEGTVDEFNAMLNIAGNVLKVFFEIYYPLPSPDEYDYGSNSNYTIKPIHGQLASLDIADIPRTHVQELCYTMFKHNIPLRQVWSRVLKFLHEGRFFFDWIYQGGGKGINSFGRKNLTKSHHHRDLDKLMKKHKLQIIQEYFQVGRKKAVRDIIQEKTGYLKNIFDEQAIREFIHQQNVFPPYWDYINQAAIKKIIDQRDTLSRSLGTQVHEQLLYGLPSPFKLENAIINGHKYLENYPNLRKDILIIAEVDLSSHQHHGRADLIVLIPRNIRKQGKNKVFWIPALVLDIKTRFRYLWTLFSKASRSNPDRLIPNFLIKEKSATEDQWKSFGFIPLRQSENIQLGIYQELIANTVSQITGIKTQPIRGVIRVAPTKNKESWHEMQQTMIGLIYKTVEKMRADIDYDPTVIVPKDQGDTGNRVSLVLSDHPKLWNHEYKERVSNEAQLRHRRAKLINFEYVRAASSEGECAAWISSIHILLSHVYYMHKEKSLGLLDLSNSLHNFTDHRLRSYDKRGFGTIVSKFTILPYETLTLHHKFDAVVITGMEYSELDEDEILASIPGNPWIYLMKHAPAGEYLSKIYKRRTITKVGGRYMYNLPIPPRKLTNKAPEFDFYRIIFSQLHQNTRHFSTLVTALRGYAAKFYNKKRKELRFTFSTPEETTLSNSLDLIPWYKANQLDFDDLEIDQYKVVDPPKSSNDSKFLAFKKPSRRMRLTHPLQVSKPYSYDHIPRFHTYYPITNSVLEKPQTPVKLTRLEILEKRRLKEFILYVQEVYPREYEENSIFAELLTMINDNKECRELRVHIQNQTYNTNTVVWSVLNFEKQKLYQQYFNTTPRDSLDSYGLTNYLMLVLKYMLNPQTSEYRLQQLWRQLFSYTLQMHGYRPKYLLGSRYDTKFIWKHVNSRELSTPHFRTVNSKVGTAIIHHKHLWIKFQEGELQLFTTPIRNRFGILDYSYDRIMDPEQIQTAYDEYEESESFTIEVQVIHIGRYDYILYFHANTWKLIGKYHEFLSNDEIKGFIITAGILKVPESSKSVEIAELDIFKGIKQRKIKQAMGDLSANQGTISLDIYELKYKRGKKIAGKFLDFRDYTSPHTLIEDLRGLRKRYWKVEDETYYLNPIDNIDWKGWIHIRNLINGYGKIPELYIPKDGWEFLFKYEDLLYDNLKTVKVNLNITHDDGQDDDGTYPCPLYDFDDVTKFRYIRAQQNGGTVPNSFRHGDCFFVSVKPPIGIRFSKEIKLKLDTLRNAHDIYEAVTDQVIYDNKYIVHFEIRADAECGEEYWFRRMFKELGEEIQWRAIGSVDMTEEYSLEYVKQEGYSVYFGFVNGAGKRWHSWPVGHKEIHTRIELFKFELEYQRENYTGVDVEGFEEKVKGLQLTIDEHLAECDDDIHSINLEEEMLYSPDKVQYGNPIFEAFKMTLLLKDLNEITEYVEIEFDGIEEAIDVVEREMKNVIKEGIDFGNTALLSLFACEYDIQDYYNSKSCEMLVDIGKELTGYELISHEREEDFYRIIETLENILTEKI